jgi:1,4-dihydroxy-6-naphthoate synthase
MTTAYLLLRLALGYQPNVTVLRFDRIVDAVASGAVDAGLIIHESRFTYGAQGLRCIADLGEWWEHETGRPIPLGAILVRRDVPDDAARALGATVRASLAYARAHEAEVSPYIREYSQELDPTVIRAHIDLYVNGYSDDVGADGIAAVDELFVRASRGGLIPSGTRPDFV